MPPPARETFFSAPWRPAPTLPANWVAEAMRIGTERVQVKVEGEMDLAGTLGLSKEAPVGFESIRTTFEVEAPGSTE